MCSWPRQWGHGLSLAHVCLRVLSQKLLDSLIAPSNSTFTDKLLYYETNTTVTGHESQRCDLPTTFVLFPEK